jgi:hypothetical protein
MIAVTGPLSTGKPWARALAMSCSIAAASCWKLAQSVLFQAFIPALDCAIRSAIGSP